MLPSASELVAKFLRTNGYDETLNSFIKEANLPLDVGTSSVGGVTIEQILQEKKTFDLSLSFEKLGVEDGHGWQNPAPSTATVLDTLPTNSNILSVHTGHVALPGSVESRSVIATTTADRRLHLLDPLTPSTPLLHSYSQLQDSPILDLVVVNDRYLLTASMSGRLLLYNTASDKVVDERKDHTKYLVKIASWLTEDHMVIATAGWDAKVYLYRLTIADGDNARLGEPFADLTVQTIPETILFVKAPGTLLPVLLLTRRDSTFIYYYTFESTAANNFTLLGRQNLAPQSNAWIAFSPSDIQLCPTDPSIAAVATSSTPHMKLLIVRLLIPPARPTTQTPAQVTEQHPGAMSSPAPDSQPLTQASQARAELLLQEREEAAISVNISTMAPQTAYSTPRLAWRPGGSGVYVTSDDGIIRGFEASTGKLIATLSAHEPGSKIRCLCTGSVESEVRDSTEEDRSHEQEYLLSGGFDQKLILWRTT